MARRSLQSGRFVVRFGTLFIIQFVSALEKEDVTVMPGVGRRSPDATNRGSKSWFNKNQPQKSTMRPGGKKAEWENKMHADSKKKSKWLRKQKPASDQIPGYGGKRKKRNQADSQPELIPYSHKCTLAQRILPTSTSDSYQLSCIDDTKAKRSHTLNLYIDCKQVPVIANQPAHEILDKEFGISQKCRLAESHQISIA